MVNKMDEKYNALVEKHTPKPNVVPNDILSKTNNLYF